MTAVATVHPRRLKTPLPSSLAPDMLKELSIRNFAIIDDLHIRFDAGPTILSAKPAPAIHHHQRRQFDPGPRDPRTWCERARIGELEALSTCPDPVRTAVDMGTA
jgi:hypothetical protein